VVKVLQIETTLKALHARGIEEDMLRLEREGIEPALAARGLTWAGLGVKPCKLFYRRRVLDMPLSDIPADANPKRADALRQARAKILDKAMRKYLFEFQELRVPTGLVVEGSSRESTRESTMTGVVLSRTEVVDGQVRTLPDTAETFRAALTVSSIGSIPEPVPGIPQRGEVYTYADHKTGLLIDGPTPVFAAGNVLTGKGNIKDSLESGTEIGVRLAEAYLGLSGESMPPLAEAARLDAHQQGETIHGVLAHRGPLAPDQVAAVIAKVRLSRLDRPRHAVRSSIVERFCFDTCAALR
jgi:ferredoxin--NADP+ reductase